MGKAVQVLDHKLLEVTLNMYYYYLLVIEIYPTEAGMKNICVANDVQFCLKCVTNIINTYGLSY